MLAATPTKQDTHQVQLIPGSSAANVLVTMLQIRREMLAQARNAIIIPPLTPFDGNVITPGTPFMARLAADLLRFIEHKIGSDPDWRHIQVGLLQLSWCHGIVF